MSERKSPFFDEFKDIPRNITQRMRDDLSRYLRRFMAVTGMAETTVSRQAVGDPSWVAKFFAGRPLMPEKYDQFVDYMDKTLEARSAEIVEGEADIRAAATKEAERLRAEAEEKLKAAASYEQIANA